MHCLCRDGPVVAVVILRVLLPMCFLFEFVSYDVFVSDLNGGERLVVGYVLSGFRTVEYGRVQYLLTLSACCLASVLYGREVGAQWLILVVCSSEGGRRLVK